MRVLRPLLIGLIATALLTPVPGASAAAWSDSYTTPATFLIIWCSEEPHSIAPQGDPSLDNPDGWLFSGEPECAFQDARNSVREAQGEERQAGGVGGTAVPYYADDIGKVLTSTPEDDLSGVNVYHRLDPPLFVDGNDHSVEGCGILTIVLPYPDSHWQGGEMQYPVYVWDWVEPVGQSDDGDLCVATSGHLHYTL